MYTNCIHQDRINSETDRRNSLKMPVVPPTTPNLIMRLPDDCLLEIFRHLDTKESIFVGQAHPRFQSVITDHGMPAQNKVVIDRTMLYYYPMTDLPWAYQAMGRNTTTLEVSGVYEDDLYYLLALFPKLRHLSLKDMNLKTIGQIQEIPQLESLTLNKVGAEKSVLVKMFNHLDETLRKIDFTSDIPKGLEALYHIRDVRICNRALTKDLSTFWKNNPEIEDIYLGIWDYFDSAPNTQRQIEQLGEKYEAQINTNFKAMTNLKNLAFMFQRMFFC